MTHIDAVIESQRLEWLVVDPCKHKSSAESAAIETVELQMLRGLLLLNYQEKHRTTTREPRTI